MENGQLGLLIHLQVVPGPFSQQVYELLGSDMREERNLRCGSGGGEHCGRELDLRDRAYERWQNCWPTM